MDDIYVAQNRADSLLQVSRIDRDNLVVTLDGTTKVTNAGRHVLLRRWDQQATADTGGVLPIVEHADTPAGLKEAWTPLEDGIQIWFAAGGQYRTGDYWLIPARTATGDVIWSHETNPDGTDRHDDNGNPIGAARGPDGPWHYYAPLARRTGPLTAGNPPDCRCLVQSNTKCPTT